MPSNELYPKLRPYLLIVVGVFLLLGVTWFIYVNVLSGSKAAAKVNGEKITIAQLDAEVDKLLVQDPSWLTDDDSGFSEADARKMMLDELIDRVLIAQTAEKEGIAVFDEEIDAQVEVFRSTYQSDEEFEEALKSAGHTLEVFRSQIRSELLLEKLLEKQISASSITDEDVRAYYDENQALFDSQGLLTFEEVRVQIEDMLLNQARSAQHQSLLEDLRSSATIEILDPTVKATERVGAE